MSNTRRFKIRAGNKIGRFRIKFTGNTDQSWFSMIKSTKHLKSKLSPKFKDVRRLENKANLWLGKRMARLDWSETVADSLARYAPRSHGAVVELTLCLPNPTRHFQQNSAVTNPRIAANNNQPGPSGATMRPRRAPVSMNMSSAEVVMERLVNGFGNVGREGNSGTFQGIDDGIDGEEGGPDMNFLQSQESIAGDDDVEERVKENFLDFTKTDFLYGLQGYRRFSHSDVKMRNNRKYPELMSFLEKAFQGI